MQGERTAETELLRCNLSSGKTVMAVVIRLGIAFVLTQSAPASPVLDDPVKQGFFKADIVAYLLAFNPLMSQNLGPLGQKFLIQG